MRNYKGILLDIDNTLYPYEKAHSIAIDTTFEEISKILSIMPDVFKSFYQRARSDVHIEHFGTASSHNRLLYFQRMFELINKNLIKYSLNAYTLYWDTFLKNMTPFPWVFEFLNSIKKKKIKICLLTDLTVYIQHRKIVKLDLFNYTDLLVTSEESGVEKPHPYIFLLGLKKMKLGIDEVCMVGDNFEKDIIGATNLGIKSFWFNQKNEVKKMDNLDGLIESIKNFKELMEYF